LITEWAELVTSESRGVTILTYCRLNVVGVGVGTGKYVRVGWATLGRSFKVLMVPIVTKAQSIMIQHRVE